MLEINKAREQQLKERIKRLESYVYEGDVLPDDYICPLCKHGASDFEPIK